MKDNRLEKKFVRLLRMIDYINNNLALTSDDIADYLGVSTRTVFRYLEDLKSVDDITVTLDNTTGYAIKFNDSSEFSNSRNMFIWTNKDMKLLEFLYNQGIGDKKIAELLERTEQAIRVRRSIMGLVRGVTMSKKDFQVGTLNSRKQGQGVRKFRKPTSNGIKNKVLYGILFAIDMDIYQKEMKIKDFSEGVGISVRSIQRYIYEGDRPSNENIEKICDYLGYPARILFYDINHKL